MASTAAAALGSPDAFTVTIFGRPALTILVLHRALVTAVGLPEAILSADAMADAFWRAVEPVGPALPSAAAAAKRNAAAAAFDRDVRPGLMAAMPPVPDGPSWQAAERHSRLYGFGWGPNACVGRRAAEVVLQCLWVGFLGLYDVALVDAVGWRLEGAGGGGEVDAAAEPVPLPPPDHRRAFVAAAPAVPVWVTLTPRGGGTSPAAGADA